ncbi:c-type cytochrome [bacterium]|nr:c-type cytochrome [bacterium]
MNNGSQWIYPASAKWFWKRQFYPTGYPIFKALVSILVFNLFLITAVWSQELPFPSNPLKGRYVLEQKGCFACHSLKGVGGDEGPDLGEMQFDGSFLELASTMWNHLPEMLHRSKELDLSFPEFTNTEFSELVAFMYYLRYLGDPGDVSRGQILVKEKNCIICHQVGGKGGSTAPSFDKLAKYISPVYMAQALWNHGPEMEEELQKRGLDRIRFKGNEIEDLSTYIRAASKGTGSEQVFMSPGNPQLGKAVFQEKGCLDCHSLDGEGEDIGPDLRTMEWNQSVSEIAGNMWNHGSSMRNSMKTMEVSWPKFSGKEMADLIAYLYFLGFVDQPGDPMAGKKSFVDKGCANCHDFESAGQVDQPKLSIPASTLTEVDLARIMWNHAPVMEVRVSEKVLPWPRLSGEEMINIFAYIHELE